MRKICIFFALAGVGSSTYQLIAPANEDGMPITEHKCGPVSRDA
jgi:hypothetical protein